MALITITELVNLGFDPHGNDVMAPEVPGVAEQAVLLGGVSAQCDPYTSGTRYIMVNTDSPCCLAFGKDPLAVAGLHRIGAGETRFYTVKPGEKLAAIAST